MAFGLVWPHRMVKPFCLVAVPKAAAFFRPRVLWSFLRDLKLSHMFATKKQINAISRLKSQAAFDLLRKTKTRWVAEGMAVQVIEHFCNKNESKQDSTAPAFCVVASKKTAKLGVDRNRMRRRLKAVALEILPSYAQLDKDYMIIARTKTNTRDFAALQQDLIWCLKKLDLLRRSPSSEEGTNA